MSRIRLRVKEIAQEKGMNIMSLSRKSYVALNTIRSVFHDPYKIITTDTLIRLADALDVPVYELIEQVPDDDSNGQQPSR